MRAAFGWLTVLRVGGNPSPRGVLPWAPLVGLVLGDLASLTGWLGARYASPLVGAVLGVALLAWLTRGLHLDGLADTADGLGPLRGRERALQVMRAGDVGPFGVATLVLTLLLQVAALAQLFTVEGGWLALWTAVVAARLAMARTGLPGVPVAEGSSLGAAVAGTVSRVWLAGCTVVAVACVLATATWLGDVAQGARLVAAGVLGLAAGELLHRRARARLGGVNGDVMGAAGEVTTAATLLAAAVLLG
ncbi:cobalamin biosynthesis protein CobS [Geodermatophilus sp. Leaf369]|uniref:adenosylcobinamide-GDP ribazoletransferase n=1 Tax=Geodermatophilus sp. Leaf369 TaxID=1736354 RepID=UPI0006F5782B|nr:adenosylcobinamide-GDP ribazoletransferase [Geodermatophilus sp. Leaf369]KQS60508.1 cobalamin biosynthesis protein CobS [Geodermatophilus sp. Leaf369]